MTLTDRTRVEGTLKVGATAHVFFEPDTSNAATIKIQSDKPEESKGRPDLIGKIVSIGSEAITIRIPAVAKEGRPPRPRVRLGTLIR